MPIRKFPNPRHTTPEGLLALGGDLSSESLLLAYRMGIFPWPMEDEPLAWFCPPERAVLEFNALHIPRSLLRFQKKNPYRLTLNQDFSQVITQCASAPRPGQPGTWITPEMKEAYITLHKLGFAHSFEAWEGEELVGGIYGVDAGGAFAGESMFHTRPNASKLALLALIDHLKSKGLDWMDIQMLTPHMEALGARTLPREEFLQRLAQTQKRGLKLFFTF